MPKCRYIFWEYSYQKSEYIRRKGNTYSTNAEGYLLLPYQADKNKDARSFSLDFIWNTDRNSTQKPDDGYSYSTGALYQGVQTNKDYGQEQQVKFYRPCHLSSQSAALLQRSGVSERY
ncbi:MAG: hypothetical protein HC912_03200 [Saprospiraceae bacterium]|nr:hypothetical protein [Saprospiraceae bacterium]